MQYCDLQIWRWLVSGEARNLLARGDAGETRAAVAELPSEYRRALEDQWALAPLLRKKLGGGDPLIGTARGAEQASDRASAIYKAGLFPAGEVVFDLCCGVGSDLRALSARGPAIGVDCDPQMALAAAFNSASMGGATLCDSALDVVVDPRGWLHIDPDRRPDERRVASAEFCQPPLAQLLPRVRQCAGAAIKLAPAAQVEDSLPGLICRQWIAVGRSCRQQVLWFGARPPDGQTPRVATLLDGDGQVVGQFASAPVTRCAEAKMPGRFLYDPSPAVRAAGLTVAWAVQHDAATLGGPTGFLTSKHRIDSPVATRFEVLEHLPANPKRLVAALKRAGLAPTTAKVRQLDWQPEAILKRTAGLSGTPCELLIGRAATTKYVVAARRG